MRPLSHHILTIFPALIAVGLVLLSATPLEGGRVSYTPNVAWLMTLTMVAFYPAAWARGFAFLLGLLQDILFGTPLGSQALLALGLAQYGMLQHRHQQVQHFRVRWLEASGTLVLWHVLLWALLHVVGKGAPPLFGLVVAGMVNALWYPVFYWLVTRVFGALPQAHRS